MLRKAYSTFGFKNDTNEMKGEIAQYQVNITIDNIGATLSIVDINTGIQYTIPFDEILKDIKKNEEKRRFGR